MAPTAIEKTTAAFGPSKTIATSGTVRLQVTEAWSNLESARLALSAARLGIAAAEESYRVQTERYAAGAATVSDVTLARTEQLRAQLDLVNAAIDARIAYARLSRAVGGLE